MKAFSSAVADPNLQTIRSDLPCAERRAVGRWRSTARTSCLTYTECWTSSKVSRTRYGFSAIGLGFDQSTYTGQFFGVFSRLKMCISRLGTSALMVFAFCLFTSITQKHLLNTVPSWQVRGGSRTGSSGKKFKYIVNIGIGG